MLFGGGMRDETEADKQCCGKNETAAVEAMFDYHCKLQKGGLKD
jgi:hypothetical protein